MCERYINWLPLTCPQLGTWPATQACALTRNWTCDILVCRPVLSPLSHTGQSFHFVFNVNSWITSSTAYPRSIPPLHSIFVPNTSSLGLLITPPLFLWLSEERGVTVSFLSESSLPEVECSPCGVSKMETCFACITNTDESGATFPLVLGTAWPVPEEEVVSPHLMLLKMLLRKWVGTWASKAT